VSQENVETVRRHLEAFFSGDYEAALAAYDPAVEYDVSIRPEGRVYRGHDGVVEAHRTWGGTWENWKIEIEEIVDAGEHVLVVDRQSGRGKGSGVEFDQQTFWVYTLREGKIIRAMWLPTRARALVAAGLSEE
jgi:ketosteroid isomerase-like protein